MQPAATLGSISSVQFLVLFIPTSRPYADAVEALTAAVPVQSPFIPFDAKVVVGAVAPASPDPIPNVLLPGSSAG